MLITKSHKIKTKDFRVDLYWDFNVKLDVLNDEGVRCGPQTNIKQVLQTSSKMFCNPCEAIKLKIMIENLTINHNKKDLLVAFISLVSFFACRRKGNKDDIIQS